MNGGQLADRFGPRYLCATVTLISAILTLLTPLIARWNVYALIVARIITGLAQVSHLPVVFYEEGEITFDSGRTHTGNLRAALPLGAEVGVCTDVGFDSSGR